MAAGGTQQFSVSGKMSDGSTTSVTATYSATGGTITTSGLYTAGMTAGTYRVIATATGGTLADTSTVTVTAASARTYTTNFPNTENPISEGGNWINGGTTGLDWSDVSTTPGLAIGHQNPLANYTDATAILTGSWSADQQGTATVYQTNATTGCNEEAEIRLRSAISAHVNRGYEIGAKVTTASDAAAYMFVVRWNGAVGDFTSLVSYTGTQYGLQNGDVLNAKIVGNTISVYKNGTLMFTTTDTIWTDGAPGIGLNLSNDGTNCASRHNDYGFSTFTATDSLP